MAQREFRREFAIYGNRAVPSAHAITICSVWVTWIYRGRSEDLCIKSVEHWLQTSLLTHSCEPQSGEEAFQRSLSLLLYSRVCGLQEINFGSLLKSWPRLRQYKFNWRWRYSAIHPEVCILTIRATISWG
jgi:hypothetical protein